MGLVLLGSSMSAYSAEVIVDLHGGKPTIKEFTLAAKKAFFKRNYIYSVTAEGKVTGVYKGWMSMDILLKDNRVIIRNTEPGGNKERQIKKYLNNLLRDFSYELAEYVL